jgi:hypothetical protein
MNKHPSGSFKCTQETYTRMGTVALFLLTLSWNQPKFPLLWEWINKPWCVYTVESLTAVRQMTQTRVGPNMAHLFYKWTLEYNYSCSVNRLSMAIFTLKWQGWVVEVQITYLKKFKILPNPFQNLKQISFSLSVSLSPSLFSFFGTGSWTQGLHLKTLHQPTFFFFLR